MSDMATPESDLQSPPTEANGVVQTIETNGDAPDSDEDIPTNPARKRSVPEEEEDQLDLKNGGEDAGGLFGSGSEDESARSPKRRKLSDEELDSGDDDDRRDRLEDDDADMEEDRAPKKDTYRLYLLRNPAFVGIEPKAFKPQSFRTPTTGHHGAAPGSTFSAASVSDSTIRWRRDPNNPSQLQSNARILRWSDGSLTLQFGTTPMNQLEMPATAIANPQQNPVKPVPTTQRKKATRYDDRQESHHYLASLHNNDGWVGITNHLTASLIIQSRNEEEDEALIRLQEAIDAATKANKGADGQGPSIISIKEDPELAKKKAEVAEKEKARAERRRQNQAERDRDRQNRVFGARGKADGAGLTVGGLEDDDGLAPSRGRQAGRAKRRPRRRNSEYSTDEEEGYRRGKTKEDEYDEDDGFLVGSDEELEIADEPSEEEEFGEADAEGEEEDEPVSKPSKAGSARPVGEGGDDVAGGRRRQRRVVDEDDED